MKQTLASIMLIGFFALAAGAGTYAYFFDIETSTGNTLTSGPFDMWVNDNNPDAWTDGVTQTWVLDDMKPGYGIATGYVKMLLNPISNPADHVEINIDYNVTEESPRLESDTDWNTDLHPDTMAKNITIIKLRYDNGKWINLLTGDDEQTVPIENNPDWRVDDVDGDGRITVYDFKMDPPDNLPPPHHIAQDTTFRMWLKLDENAGNDFQGDTFKPTVFFTLNQVASQ